MSINLSLEEKIKLVLGYFGEEARMNVGDSEPTEGYWLCPLYSFECDSTNVELNNGIYIKPAPGELKKYIYQQTQHLYGLWEDPSEFDWAVFLPYRTIDTRGLSRDEQFSVAFREQQRNTNLLVDLLTTLRLHRSGKVIAGPLVSSSVNNSQWSFGGTTIWTFVSEKNFILEDTKYSFRLERLYEAKKLFQDILAWREKGVLKIIDITLRRFHSAYHGDIEDRIIDQMIAFESLYIGDDKELGYKLALRTAFLLSKRKDHRSKIFANIKQAYNYRSRIVHGDNPPSRDELRVIVPKTEDYLRQSIRRFLLLLSQGKSLKEIREKLLDENILKNGKPLALKE